MTEAQAYKDARENLNKLLSYLARSEGGSDLHLQVNQPPVFRINGRLARSSYPALSEADIQVMAMSIMNDVQRKRFMAERDIDLSYEIQGVARYRVNAFFQRGKVGSAFRLIPFKVKTIDELALPLILKDLTLKPRGFILITGPTGSGKSTTLAAMIEHMNTNVKRHIITVEDPIEFSFEDKMCLAEQREIGIDSHSFEIALKHVMRENPDAIMIGEMRDLETISLALSAAEMGSLVLATLHTRTAYQTVDRIIDVFPAEQQQQVRLQLSTSLTAVLSQTLVPLASGRGRMAAFEILICNAAVRNAIREGKPHQIPSIIQASAEEGMILMDSFLEQLVLSRKVKYDDVIYKVSDPKRFAEVCGFMRGVA